VPDTAQALIDQTAMILHVKITELLLEVDEWTGFTALRPPEVRRPGQGQTCC
jgi:hypothetical protein